MTCQRSGAPRMLSGGCPRTRSGRRARSARWRRPGPRCRRCRACGASPVASQASRIGSTQRHAASTSSRRMNRVGVAAHDVHQQPLVGVRVARLEGLGEADVERRPARRRMPPGPGSLLIRYSLMPSSGCRRITSRFGSMAPTPCGKIECGDLAEVDHDLRHALRQALAGAQVERHAGPAPVARSRP